MSEPLDCSRVAGFLCASEQPQAFLAECQLTVDADIRLLPDAAASADFVRGRQLAHRIEGAARVLDLTMPGLNGMEVMIAELEKLPRVNSARVDDLLRASVHTARSRGATVHGAVGKPLTAARLTPLPAQHCHDQRQAAPHEQRATKLDWACEVPAAGPVML